MLMQQELELDFKVHGRRDSIFESRGVGGKCLHAHHIGVLLLAC
jgi:hypothetical protein